MAGNGNHPCIAVVGSGAAGTLTAVHLLRSAEKSKLSLDIWLIDPAREAGRGPAYATRDPRHLLNVAAGRMSALADDPDHFVRWLLAKAHGAADPAAHAPRMDYGRYLADTLDLVAARCTTARLHRLHDRVTGVETVAGSRVRLDLGAGTPIYADAAVLALGNCPPDCGWAPQALRESPCFINDPWRPDALSAVPDTADVLLVGTGLTMADVAVTLAAAGRVVHAVSRHGMVPQAHLQPPAQATPCPVLTGRHGLPALRRAVLRHISECRRRQGDWRAGVDSLRPLTNTLWQQLPVADRARFLREDLRLWNVHRHRMAPATGAALQQAHDNGMLEVAAGQVVDAAPAPGGLRVRLSDRRVLEVGAVVNCTGSATGPGAADDPLVQGLLGAGTARADAVGVGLDTMPDGRLLPARGERPPLWTLGSLRGGNLLESTAIPEIREQADDVAASIVRVLRGALRTQVA